MTATTPFTIGAGPAARLLGGGHACPGAGKHAGHVLRTSEASQQSQGPRQL
jgi:hypothetical protein